MTVCQDGDLGETGDHLEPSSCQPRPGTAKGPFSALVPWGLTPLTVQCVPGSVAVHVHPIHIRILLDVSIHSNPLLSPGPRHIRIRSNPIHPLFLFTLLPSCGPNIIKTLCHPSSLQFVTSSLSLHCLSFFALGRIYIQYFIQLTSAGLFRCTPIPPAVTISTGTFPSITSLITHRLA